MTLTSLRSSKKRTFEKRHEPQLQTFKYRSLLFNPLKLFLLPLHLLRFQFRQLFQEWHPALSGVDVGLGVDAVLGR